MDVILDRFEGNFVICEKENGEMIDIQRNKIPKEAKEGDVLTIDDSKITINIVKTKKRKEEIEKHMKDLWD